jgi:ankyrin repeat protein
MSGFGMALFGANHLSTTHTTSIDASTPWVAASDGNLPLLQTSLSALKLTVAAQDENGYTCLHAAASYSQLPIIEWLLTQDSSLLHQVDKDGDSALHYASTVEACQSLVTQSIDVQTRNHSGKTALEAKRAELDELIQDEDFEETDPEAVTLRRVVEYLASLSTISQ